MSRLIDWNFEVLQGLFKQIDARRKASKSTGSMTRNSARVPEYSTKQLAITLGGSPRDHYMISSLPERNKTTMSKSPRMSPMSCVILLARLLACTTTTLSITSRMRRTLYSRLLSWCPVSWLLLTWMWTTTQTKWPRRKLRHRCTVTRMESLLILWLFLPVPFLPSFMSKLVSKAASDTTSTKTHCTFTFSCSIFSVDQYWVSNAQLVKEQVLIAMHNVRSVAEQNSLELSWKLLMSSTYANLRSFLFSTQGELSRFRQLVVNVRVWIDMSCWLISFWLTILFNTSNDYRLSCRLTLSIKSWKNFVMGDGTKLSSAKRQLTTTVWSTKKLKECGVFGVSSGEYLVSTMYMHGWPAGSAIGACLIANECHLT